MTNIIKNDISGNLKELNLNSNLNGQIIEGLNSASGENLVNSRNSGILPFYLSLNSRPLIRLLSLSLSACLVAFGLFRLYQAKGKISLMGKSLDLPELAMDLKNKLSNQVNKEIPESHETAESAQEIINQHKKTIIEETVAKIKEDRAAKKS